LNSLAKVSSNIVPLTVIKGAGHEFIPLPQGENATTADFHSIRTKTTDSPSYFTSGFYKIEAGSERPAHYNFEETKYVLSGQIDILVSSLYLYRKCLLHIWDVGTYITWTLLIMAGLFYRTRLLASPIT
jgi:hypothetical protein